MEITLADLWFVIDVPYKSCRLPETAFHGETAKADAIREAARMNADPTLVIGTFRQTYKVADYQEVVDLMTDNTMDNI